MLTGPLTATRYALEKAGMSVDDVDLFECNEAFASVPMAWMQELGISHEKVNVQDRKSVVLGKSVSVRVDLGGRRIINKTIPPTSFVHTTQIQYTTLIHSNLHTLQLSIHEPNYQPT